MDLISLDFRISFILSFLIYLSSLSESHSQTIPNSDFESWGITSQFPRNFPIGWSTSVMSGFGGGVDSTHDAYSGQTAVSIYTWYSYVPGGLINGNCSVCTTLDEFRKAGTPINYRPLGLSGYYKFQLGSVDTNNLTNDSAIAIILLKKYNHTLDKIDTIGLGVKTLSTSSNYQNFTIPINYLSNDIPDSIIVGFFSNDLILFPNGGQRNNCLSGACMMLTVDKLSLLNSTSVKQHNKAQKLMTVFPNPSDKKVNFSFEDFFSADHILKLYNPNGALINALKGSGQYQMNINTSSFEEGIYYYTLYKSGEKSLSGKLIIHH